MKAKNIDQIFKGNYDLMDQPQVEELIEYTRELEGEVFSNNIEQRYDKELILLEIVRDIYNSCRDMEHNQELNNRYPDLYPEVDTTELLSNLKNYIIKVCADNKIKL